MDQSTSQPLEAHQRDSLPDVSLPDGSTGVCGINADWIQRFNQLGISDTRTVRPDNRMARKIGILAGRITRGLAQTSISRSDRFISDILRNCTPQSVDDLLQAAYRSKKETIIIAYHPEQKGQGHIHVYHICAFHQSHCRCHFLKGFDIKKRDPRRTPFVRSQFGRDFWVNFLFYFLSPPRQLVFFQVDGRNYIPFLTKAGIVGEWDSSNADGPSCVVEGSDLPCKDLVWETGYRSQAIRQNHEHSQRTADAIDTGYSSTPGINMQTDKFLQRKLTIQGDLLTALETLLVVPVESSCHVKQWLQHPTLSIFNASSPDYKNACSLYNRRLVAMTFNEIKQLHLQYPTGLFMARSADHYFNPTESLEHIETLLRHQYPNDQDFLEFIQTLYDICERSIPKLNSLYLVGPTNCGKSWFADMVTAFYLNVGHVKNFVRGQNFPLNDCVCRRILLWNEPSIMPSAYESVKMLCGGDPCPCAVKYEGDGKIMRTPLLFTSNHTSFSSTEVWTTRVRTYKWKTCPFLKNVHKYPHPFAYALLVDKYLLQ